MKWAEREKGEGLRDRMSLETKQNKTKCVLVLVSKALRSLEKTLFVDWYFVILDF